MSYRRLFFQLTSRLPRSPTDPIQRSTDAALLVSATAPGAGAPVIGGSDSMTTRHRITSSVPNDVHRSVRRHATRHRRVSGNDTAAARASGEAAVTMSGPTQSKVPGEGAPPSLHPTADDARTAVPRDVRYAAALAALRRTPVHRGLHPPNAPSPTCPGRSTRTSRRPHRRQPLERPARLGPQPAKITVASRPAQLSPTSRTTDDHICRRARSISDKLRQAGARHRSGPCGQSAARPTPYSTRSPHLKGNVLV